MVHCVAFGCNANSSKHRRTHHFFQFPTNPVFLKKWLAKIKRANFKPTKHSRLCSAHFEKTCLDRDPEMLATLGYTDARISLKCDAVPTIFPVVKAVLMPSTRRRQVSAQAGSMAALTKSKASGSCKLSASKNDELTKSAYRKRQRIKGDSIMAENAVKRTPSTGGASLGKMRKNVAKKSTTKPPVSLQKQTVTLSDPNMVTLAAKLKVVMNGQQKNAPTQGHTDGMVNGEPLTNGTDVQEGCLDTVKPLTGSGTVSTDDARKGSLSVVDNGDIRTSEDTAANQGGGDTKLVNTSCESNLDRSITSTCSAKSPGRNGTHILKIGLDSSQKPAKSGLVITPKMNSYVRSLAKVAASNVDVTLAQSPSGGTSCSSTTHIPESTTPSKVICNKGNLFDNLNNLSSERNGGCDLDGKCVVSSDSGMSLDEVTGKLPQTKVTPMVVLGDAADDGAKEDILMDGVEDDANFSDVDDSILDDPSDQKLSVNGAEKKNCAHAAIATSDNKNLNGKPEEKVIREEETSVKEQQSSSNCDSATVKVDSISDSAADSMLTAANNDDVDLENKSETKCDGADTENKPSSITQHSDINVTHRKRVMLDPTETEPKKKFKFEEGQQVCAENQTDSSVDSSCVRRVVESSSSMAVINNGATAKTVDELGAISVTLGELDKLIKRHIDDDGSVLSQLQEKITSMQENTESWRRKMKDLQQQVAEITQLQQQHNLRRSHLRHKVQTRNWGIQVDEQKIKTAMTGTPSLAKTTDTNIIKTETSVLPISSTSHIKSLLQSVRPAMSEATVRPTVSASSVRPTMSESAIRPAVSQALVLLTTSSETTRPIVADTVAQPSVSDVVVRPTTQGSRVQQLLPVTVSSGTTIALIPVGTLLSRSAMPTGTMTSTQLQNRTPTVQQIRNNCVTSTFNVKLQTGGSISTVTTQAQPVMTVIATKKIIDLTDDDDDVCTTLATVKPMPVQMVNVRPPPALPPGQLIVRQPLSSTPLQPGTFILQSSSANPGTLYLQPAGVRGVTPPRAPTYIYPNRPTGGGGTFMLQQVTNASGTAPTVTLTQPLPRLQGVSTGMLLMTRPPPPLQSAPGILVKTQLEKLVEKLHPAPLPPLPFQKADVSMKLMPPKPSLKISRVQQGIVLSWSMSIDDSHAKISKYQLFAYQEGTQTPNSSLWKKIGDVKALPLPMACTLTQFQEGNKYHFAVRAVDIHERLGVFSDPSSIHLTKTV